MKAATLTALSLAALSFAGPALAKVPYFAAKCPTDILVETDRSGRAYIAGKKASVRSSNANYYEIAVPGFTASVAVDAGSLIVNYTGRHRANGVCQVVEQEKVESAPPSNTPAAAPSSASPAGVDDVPARDKKACLRAVKAKTHNPKVTVLEALSSEANNTVTVGVGAQRAPWRCLVKRGRVADVMSLTNEGAL
jgi:hypothetical protein